MAHDGTSILMVDNDKQTCSELKTSMSVYQSQLRL